MIYKNMNDFSISNDKDNKKTKSRVNQQVRNYKKCLKNSFLGELKFNFSRGLRFSLY